MPADLKLHKKFLKIKGVKAAEFTECLNNIQVEGTSTSLLDYTKDWVGCVNRGGLFEVNDEAYFLFVAIESTMRSKLTNHLKRSIGDQETGAKLKSGLCFSRW